MHFTKGELFGFCQQKLRFSKTFSYIIIFLAYRRHKECYRLPGHRFLLSQALLLPGVMEEERGESGFGPHSVYQLDGPGPAVHAMGHVKYEEESENKNILKYLLYSIE